MMYVHLIKGYLFIWLNFLDLLGLSKTFYNATFRTIMSKSGRTIPGLHALNKYQKYSSVCFFFFSLLVSNEVGHLKLKSDATHFSYPLPDQSFDYFLFLPSKTKTIAKVSCCFLQDLPGRLRQPINVKGWLPCINVDISIAPDCFIYI
jgi:hypothetical protein